MFAGSHAGAERAAIAYSILGSCALAEVNPIEYLADVLPRLARGIVVARDVPLMPAAPSITVWSLLQQPNGVPAGG